MTLTASREGLRELPNPLGLDGIEFVEYRTGQPQVLGQSLERLGFHAVARHRSRDVTLYRQGDMNLVVNARRGPEDPAMPERAELAAVALRVRDAARAHAYAPERGAWAVATRVEVMELNIPAIHGPGGSRLYFVDRYREFSIYDVDFTPLPGVDPHPPAPLGLHPFGVVQDIGLGRTAEWARFYADLFDFRLVPEGVRYGILSQGCILASPCGKPHWQLIEPEVDAIDIDEFLHRLAFGTPDVPAAVAALKARGVSFVEQADAAHTGARGAVTRPSDQGPRFEFVRHEA